MKPTWESDGVQLYLGDCLQIMPELAAGSVDAVVTDPPYGIGWETNYADKGMSNATRSGNYPPVIGDDHAFDPRPFLRFPTVILFGANHYSDKLPPSSGWLVWDKRDGVTPNDQSDCEMAWTNQNRAARIYRHLWMGMIKASEGEGRRVHPTQKPVQLMAWILVNRVPAGCAVLDPFMGSGTTGVACVQTGRKFIGVEIDEGYFNIAKKRISEAQLQIRMPLEVAHGD